MSREEAPATASSLKVTLALPFVLRSSSISGEGVLIFDYEWCIRAAGLPLLGGM